MIQTSTSYLRWVSVLVVIAGMAAPASAGFTIKDLGVIVGSGTSAAEAINNSGGAAGVATGVGGGNVAVESSGGGSFQLISVPNSTSSIGMSINDANQVAGYFVGTNGTTHGFYTSGGQATQIQSLAGGTFTMASGINNGGQVVGTGDIANGQSRAFIASGGGTPTAINPLGSGGFNQGSGINDNGTVVGTSETSPGGLLHAFLTGPGGTPVDILSRNAAGNFAFNTFGAAIANDGDIVGYGDVGRGEHAFFASSKGGALTDLGILNGASSSLGLGVNDMSLVVGQDQFGSGLTGSRAFLWGAGHGMVDLNTLIPSANQAHWVLASATGINDLDQISGMGYLNGVLHGFVLTPISGQSIFDPADSGGVPEPPALVLTLLGSGIAAAWRWRSLRRGRSGGRAAA
jgi:probable HAF family extracellular repeat protein